MLLRQQEQPSYVLSYAISIIESIITNLKSLTNILVLCFQVTTFADMEGEETFDPAHLGSAEEVVEERIADDDVVLIKGTKTSSAVCYLLSVLDQLYILFQLIPKSYLLRRSLELCHDVISFLSVRSP